MPRKEFESFTRLDASDVNTYLMDQSVMSFAGTAARGSAIGTATEGMVTYLNDINSLSVNNGTAWTTDRTIQVFGGTAARDSAIGTAVVGMFSYLEDIDSLSVNNGTAWTTDRTIQVFAGTAARGSAIPSPVEGMYAHLNDTDALTYYNGSAWANAGASAGLVPIVTQTVSGVTAINFNNCFSAVYTNYKILMSGTVTTRGAVGVRLRVGGVDAAGANYAENAFYRDNVTFATGYTTGLTSASIAYFETDSNIANSDLSSPFLARKTVIDTRSTSLGSVQGTWRFGNAHTLATSYDGISVLPPSAFTGSITIYGYKE